MAAALWETVVAVIILCNVVVAGLSIELARKLGKHSISLRRLWSFCRRRFPAVCDQVILKFAEIWDAFTESRELDFEDRFAVFCNSLGDFLEALVQGLVDRLENIFKLDAAEQAAALCRVPRQQVAAEACCSGVGRLKVTSCAICFEDWKEGESVRTLPTCAHVFHCKCVDVWLYRREQCPLCREPVAL